MPGVRDAAVALIAEAPEATVFTILKMLIAAIEPVPARAAQVPPSPAPRPVLSPRAKPAAATSVDENWETLRRQVRTTMAEQGANYADIAAAIGRSEIAVRISLGSRRPPKPIVRSRLQAWLEQAAPAVAAAPAPFPGSGTGHRGNGHDHPTGAPYSSAA
jgi:hypothetical protein